MRAICWVSVAQVAPGRQGRRWIAAVLSLDKLLVYRFVLAIRHDVPLPTTRVVCILISSVRWVAGVVRRVSTAVVHVNCCLVGRAFDVRC